MADGGELCLKSEDEIAFEVRLEPTDEFRLGAIEESATCCCAQARNDPLTCVSSHHRQICYLELV